ncbi:hypothetical protein BMS3Bbin02_00726 [bacterium BMS3Bbin02]|nr:hypothetical protein BMS3Bbin02_00726 [bacterium BMS3Bbin02]
MPPDRPRRGGAKRIVGIVVSSIVVAVIGVPGISIASRSTEIRGSFDDIVLVLLMMTVLGPLVYLAGAIIWDGRLAQLIRVVGFVLWVLVGFVFLRSGVGLVTLALALTVVPSLKKAEGAIPTAPSRRR